MKDLDRRLDLLAEAQRVERLLGLLREKRAVTVPKGEDEQALKEWLRWAERRAKRLMDAALDTEGLP